MQQRMIGDEKRPKIKKLNKREISVRIMKEKKPIVIKVPAPMMRAEKNLRIILHLLKNALVKVW